MGAEQELGHRATVYTIRVRRKREMDDSLPLGNIDGSGTYLAGLLADYLGDLESFDAEETRSVQSSSVTRDGPELYVSVLHGQTGMVADIFGKEGDLRLHQTADDTQKVRCGCLFRLPPADDMGFLATHINNGRAIKGLLDKGIQGRFRKQFPDHFLAIRPFIEGSVFQEALIAGRLMKLKLVKVDRSDDLAEAGLGKWIEGGAEAKEEFTLKPRAKGAYLRTQLPLSFLRGDGQAFAQILQFDGQTYDEARVEVQLANGRTRVFTIGDPDGGNPISEDLHDLQLQGGEPTDDSLRGRLRLILDQAVDPRRGQ
jgi:hypothetical protein